MICFNQKWTPIWQPHPLHWCDRCTQNTHITAFICWTTVYTHKHVCSGKWLAPWATAAVGSRLPSQRCLILMQVNPTLTSSSPHWPIISLPLPLSLSFSLPYTGLIQSFSATLVSHRLQSLSHHPPSIPYIALISLSLSLTHTHTLSLFYFWPHLAVSLPLPTSELP